MKKRMVSLITMLCMLCAMLPCMPVQASMNINIGDYLQMGTYYGEPILWRCVDIDENGPLILSDKILCIKAFDASGDNTSGSHGRNIQNDDYRKKWGSNYWADSNIRDWLNSESNSVTWSCGNPPDKEHVRVVYTQGYNAYDNEPGFLTNFTQSEKNAMLTVTQKSLLDCYEYGYYNENYLRENRYIYDCLQNYDTAYSEEVTDKMFLLDVKQVNNVYNNLGDYYKAYPTKECVDNSDYKKPDLKVDNMWHYWLRSPIPGNCGTLVLIVSNYLRYVESQTVCRSEFGIRPAFYLNLSSTVKSGSGTESNPYIIDGGSEENNSGNKFQMSDWAREEVEYADENNIVPDEIKERYQEPITRREFCLYVEKMINKFFNKTDIKNFRAKNNVNFDDTDEDCVMLAASIGVVSGYDDGTFRPNDNITRQEGAAMIYRFREFLNEYLGIYISNTSGFNFRGGALGENDPDKFYDIRDDFDDGADIASWAVSAVTFVYDNVSPKNNNPIMGGTGDNCFSPTDNYTCEQAAMSFVRFLDVVLQAYASKVNEIDKELSNEQLQEEIKKKREEQSVHLAIVELDNAITDFGETLYNRVDSINEDKKNGTNNSKDKKEIEKAIIETYDIEPKSGNKSDLTKVKNELYEAMYDYTSSLAVVSIKNKKGNEGKDLVEALFENVKQKKWDSDGKKYNGYSVEITPYGGYGKAGVGSVVLSKGSKSYEFFYNSTEDAAKQAASDFLSEGAYLAKDLTQDACDALVNDMFELAVGKTAKELLNGKISSQTKKILKQLGMNDVDSTLSNWKNVYDSVSAIHDIATNNDIMATMSNAKKLYNNTNSYISSSKSKIIIEDAVVDAAKKKVDTAYQNLKSALFDCLYGSK